MNIKILLTVLMISLGAPLYAVDMIIHNNSGARCMIWVTDALDQQQANTLYIDHESSQVVSLASSGTYTIKIYPLGQPEYSIMHELDPEHRDVIIPVRPDNETDE